MNLLFMQNGLAPYGIPRNGLVSIIDPGRQILTGTTGQTLIDYTGKGNSAQLGSTAGSDTNDPAWSGNGLTFGTDDYCKSSSPAFDDMAQFTCITVAKLNSYGEKPGRIFDKVKRFGAIGSPYPQFFQYYTSGYLGYGGNIGVPLNNPFIVNCSFNGTTPIMYVNKTKNTVSVIEDGNGIGGVITDASYDLYIGNRADGARVLNGTIYLQLWYNRILSDAEYMQAYNGLRRLMSSRGVVI